MKNLKIPEIGKEYIEPDEAKNTQVIIDSIIKRLKRDYPSSGTTLRQFHAKMHGCVKATFTVLPVIAENFQYGFLIPGKSYEAWIRYSNGNTKVVDDRKGDLRGMAIKLLNVPGEMLLQDHALPQSHDFLLVSYPTLMSPSVASFKKNIKALCSGSLGLVAFGLNPANWPTIIRTLQSMKKCPDLLSTKYYSVSPYRLGTTEQAIKYGAFPVSEEVSSMQKEDKDFLRKKMKEVLAQKTVQIDFMIQFQQDAVKNPIENPCIQWKSAWHKVASIEIHSQDFDTAERYHFGENLTLSPWHCHKENQPLGAINRARKAAYEAISTFRLQQNQR